MCEPYLPAKEPADWMRDVRLEQVFAVLEAAGGQVRVAGGAVRNWLMGEPVSDIDLATTVLPQQVMAAGKQAGFSVHPTGIDHGTVTLVNDGLVVEVTTLRADVETDGRRAVVAFTGNWRKDAERRDFTINALYCDLTGQVFDVTGQGLDDIEHRRIRFVGDAERRIREDYLRILRFFRFEARYGAGRPPDEAALRACIALKDGLSKISVERWQSEVLKIVVAVGARQALAQMCDGGILPLLLRTNCDLGVFDAMLEAERLLRLESDAILRLACLTTETDNLRLSRRQAERMLFLAGTEALTPDSDTQTRKLVLYRSGAARFKDLVVFSLAHAGSRIDEETAAHWQHLFSLANDWPVPKFPLAGKDLLAAGFTSGKRLGELLAELEQDWIDSQFTLTSSQLLATANKRL